MYLNIPATNAVPQTTFNNHSKGQKNAVSGVIRVENSMCQLTRTAPFFVKGVFSNLEPKDYRSFFASLLETGVQPPVRPFGKLIRVLMKGNYNVNSLRKSEQPLYEILLKSCHANMIKRNLMVGKLSSNLPLDLRGSQKIMITFPSFGKKENLPDLIHLYHRINEGLYAMTPQKFITFSQGPDSHKRFRCTDKIIFPEHLFGEQGTACESLRCILNGADKAITPLVGNARFLYAISIHRLLECLKKENFPSLPPETIDTVSQEFPELSNLCNDLARHYL